MRVLHLASEYPPGDVYGLGRFVHGLARAQAAAGDDVFVLTNSHGGEQDDCVVDGVRLHRIAFPNPPRPPDGHGEVLQFNHGLVARFLERRSAFAGVEIVASHDWLTAPAAREISRSLGVPLVVTIHDEVVGKQFGVLDSQSSFVHDLEALTVHDATHVVANSRYVAGKVHEQYGVPKERITAIPGGIDPELVRPPSPERVEAYRAELALPDQLLVVYVGRLDAEKGLETLADAARQVLADREDVVFAIAGTGRLETHLRQRLGHAGSNVRFLGYVHAEELRCLYQAADLALVPSTYEPFGLVALEAMLAATAVVVAASGGLREIVRDERDGLVVPPCDAGALAAAIRRLSEDSELRERLARQGAERARGFCWDSIAERTRAVYANVRAAGPSSLCQAPPALPAEAPVSALLVTHEAPVHAAAALRSLFSNTCYDGLEAVVVDDGSSAAALAELSEAIDGLRGAGHEVTLIQRDERGGLAVGMQQAAAAAQGELLLLLADEVEILHESPGWLRGLIWLMRDKDAVSVSPVLAGRDGPHEAALAPRRVEWNSAACLLVRRDRLQLTPPPQPVRTAVDLGKLLGRSASADQSHWVHPVRALFAEGEATRGAGELAWTARSRLPASIVMVTCGNLALTQVAIDAVLSATRGPYELVFVDNGSEDETLRALHARQEDLGGRVPVQVLANAENLGYSVAANRGIRAARGRHVVLLNNDTRVEEGWLEHLLAAADSGDQVGVVTAKILNPDGTVQNAGGILHHPDGSFTVPRAGEDRLAPTVTERRTVENAAGPCMLLTRRLIETVGIFDEAYSPAYYEDSDLCFRARKAGLTLLYEPGAEVYHKAQSTTSSLVRQGRLDLQTVLESNRIRFYGQWLEELEQDENVRVEQRAAERQSPQCVLLCYHHSQTTTAAYCEAALREAGHRVYTAGRGQEIDLGDEATASDLCRAVGEPVDLVLAIEGETYFPPGLEAAPCPTAFWAIDNHLHARGPRPWHFDAARGFDHVFVAQRDYVDVFAEAGIDVTWLPLACDPLVHRGSSVERDLDVVFVGNVLPIHRRRRRLLEQLQTRFRVHVAQGVYREDMAGLHGRAKVVFNCSLAGDLNMRVFEALATGSLLVTDRIANGLSTLFGDGEHLALYDDATLARTIERYLRDADARHEIGRRGQRLVLRHHTYAHRMRALLRSVRSSKLQGAEA